MRHFVRLGFRGLLLEFGGLLMRAWGGLHYHWLRFRRARKAGTARHDSR